MCHMASDTSFPYTPTPGKLEEFLKKLQSVGVPPKIDQKYLGAVGFTSSSSRPFIPVMKKAQLIDPSGKPTDFYTRGLRGGEAGRTLVATGIRAGYENLFQVYSDAPDRPESDLAVFFKSHSDLDDKKVSLAVKTFKAVCKFGDFNSATGSVGSVDQGSEGESNDQTSQIKSGHSRQHGSNGASSVVINVNIALSVDATSDAAVYDAFFAAMGKHLKGLVDGDA